MVCCLSVCTAFPQVHVGSSMILNRRRYAFVYPCPVTIAVKFCVRFNFMYVCMYLCMYVCMLVAVVYMAMNFNFFYNLIFWYVQ
jgi:hypothetical protein